VAAAGLTTLWVIRAGDSLWHREGRLQGRADLPLSPEGRGMVMADIANLITSPVEGELRPSVIHHPPDEGARETARLLAKALGAKPRTAEELAEPDLGLFDGITLAQFEERFPTRFRQWEDEPLGLIPPDGEPFIDARSRVVGEVARLLRRRRGRHLGVVLHPTALAFLRAAFAKRRSGSLADLVEGRPRIERYLLPRDAPERLLAACEAPL